MAFLSIDELRLLKRYIGDILPQVHRELAFWEALAADIPDPALRRQALNSLYLKRFHAQGGSVFALMSAGWEKELTGLIVAVQTISDYLDNLCDRLNVFEAESFRSLHQAMLDCLDPESGDNDYYINYPCRNDGDYLKALVAKSRDLLSMLPGHRAALTQLQRLALLYCELQTYKHIRPAKRRLALERWAADNQASLLGVEWWEFSAAAGSTLGLFALMAAAAYTNLTAEECDRIVAAYFPWICGLHILLDYLIDQEEDLQEGDFNFTRWYPDAEATARRLERFVTESLACAGMLPHPAFHLLVVKGLLALYFSDPKTSQPVPRFVAEALLNRTGLATRQLYYLCRWLRNNRFIHRKYPYLRMTRPETPGQ